MRLEKIKNPKIDNAFKNTGVKVEPLSDEEYRLLVNKYKTLKGYKEPVAFDEATDIIIGKLPESKKPSEKTMPDGNILFSVPVILYDGTWTSFLTTQDEADDISLYMGNKIVIVGKLKTKGDFTNINKYRGCMIPNSEEEEDDGI